MKTTRLQISFFTEITIPQVKYTTNYSYNWDAGRYESEDEVTEITEKKTMALFRYDSSSEVWTPDGFAFDDGCAYYYKIQELVEEGKLNLDDPVKPNPIFNVLQELGNIDDQEIYQTFNMGMGFTIIAPEADAEAIAKENPNAKIVGRVEEGNGVYFAPGKFTYDHY